MIAFNADFLADMGRELDIDKDAYLKSEIDSLVKKHCDLLDLLWDMDQ